MVHIFSNKYVKIKVGYYRPQRSWGKVMFSQACVILFTGGVCLSACWDTPPGSRHPPQTRHHPPWDQDQAPPLGVDTPPWEHQTPPQTPGTPPGAEHAGRYGHRAGGTHPTGMQSCC